MSNKSTKNNPLSIPTIGSIGDRVGSSPFNGLGTANRTVKREASSMNSNVNINETEDEHDYYDNQTNTSVWPSFVTPEFYTKNASYGIRLFLAEFLAMTLALSPVFLTQGYINNKYGLLTTSPLPIASEDYSFLATIRAFSFFVAAYLFAKFANTGVHLNCAVSLVMTLVGGDSWISLFIRWVAQFSGASLSFLLIFGFSYVTSEKHWGSDVGVGVAQVNLGEHTAAYNFLWELLCSTFYCFAAVALYSSQRLFNDAIDSKKKPKHRPDPQLKGVPVEYHRFRYPAYTFQSVLVLAGLIYILSYSGNIATTGNGIVGNFFYAYPRYFNTEKITTWDSSNPIAAQGTANFFGPFLGGLIGLGIWFAFASLTKSIFIAVKDETQELKDPEYLESTREFPPYNH